MKQPLIRIKGITRRYKHGHGGIENISFSIFQGEYLILAGPNGSGKTTLLRHLNGLITPDHGQITLNGQDIFQDLTRTRKSVGMVFQDADTQIVGETVFDEVAFGLENLKMSRKQINVRVNRILEKMDLSRFKDRHPATLSGGEKRRLTIAGILVMDPDIIVLDEPFANLDYPTTQDLIQRVARLNRAGKTIVMATHDVDMVIDDAQRILILDKGHIAAVGTPLELCSDLGRYGLKPCCACRGHSAAFSIKTAESATKSEDHGHDHIV